MTLTSHGHHIKGSPEDKGDLPPEAKCGGPGLCGLCSSQEIEWQREARERAAVAELSKLDPQHEGLPVARKFRTRVVDIEALQFTGGPASGMDVAQWVNANGGNATWMNSAAPWSSPDGNVGHEGWPENLTLETSVGFVEAPAGSWIVRDIEGGFYHVEEDDFPKKYEVRN